MPFQWRDGRIMRAIKAFSLMELMVVVTIAGVVAAFAIPNYQRSVNTAAGKDAVNNLRLIAAAQQLYLARNGSYYPSAGTVNVFAINTNLHLSILQQQGVVYSCTNAAPHCSAVKGADWTYSITLPTALPVCTAGTCPYTPT